MNIGYDAKRIFLNHSGLGNYSRNVLDILAKKHPKTQFKLYTPKLKMHEGVAFIKGLDNVAIKTPDFLFKGILSSLWRYFYVLKQAKEDQIEIYHGLSNEIPYLRKKTGIKLIVTIHDLIFLRYPEQYSFIDRFIYNLKSKYACKNAAKIIAISEQTKNDIVKFYGIDEHKIEVIYQSCHKIFKKPASKELQLKLKIQHNLPSNFLLYVGSVNERKNLMTILRALKTLPSHKLVIIGHGGEYKIKCQKFVEDNKMSHRVQFLKIDDTHELAAIYQMARIMIYPSVFEGFGIPIIESLYSKTPVITSRGSCFAEAGGPSSIYIDPKNEIELANAILKIEADPEIRTKMIEDGCKHVQQFSEEMVAKKIHQLYENTSKI